MATTVKPNDKKNLGEDAPAKANEVTKALATIAPYAAVVAMVVWICGLVVLYNRVAAGEEQWARLIVIFGSIQGVAFGAFGAIFGTTIQLNRVANAEKKADDAKRESDAVKGTADLGKQLAAAVKGEAGAMKVTTKFGFNDALNLMADKESLRLANKLLPNN